MKSRKLDTSQTAHPFGAIPTTASDHGGAISAAWISLSDADIAELWDIRGTYGKPDREPGWFSAKELAPAFNMTEKNTHDLLINKLVPAGEFETMEAKINGRTVDVFRRVKPDSGK